MAMLPDSPMKISDTSSWCDGGLVIIRGADDFFSVTILTHRLG